MRRYSPQYYSPPRRSYGGGGGGGRGRSPQEGARNRIMEVFWSGTFLWIAGPVKEKAEELRAPFERYGEVRDVYMPKDYYTGEPRGFAFIQFVDSYEAAEAQEISVVVAAETRKRPEEMRQRTRVREPSGHGGRRSSYYGRSRSRSRSPRDPSGSRSRYRSRSYSPAPRQRGDSISPRRRHRDNPRSPQDLPSLRDGDHDRRPYSPGYDNGAGPIENAPQSTFNL
ncbi:serine/arginine-rich SC35-like splicing factor SCL30 [Pyrus ussuriensis x Pyrus communis]|uniref:Serine/arginine-rich SC35-like splicing factor SCL30 n=1 Tax=Pyrus ussuriensis x Pyrus communis TaxID=2448454 RepID=A0A5N5FAJ8_9ROSA|nr:serine/arginine-rich SC35-like splicing factor SCL30 [Pyrus ussuriensis x Pyrus communis]